MNVPPAVCVQAPETVVVPEDAVNVPPEIVTPPENVGVEVLPL